MARVSVTYENHIARVTLTRGDKMNALESLLSKFDLKEMVRTGKVVMGRGDELGTLEPGKLADILVVDGDVLGDISILENRSKFIAVMQGGMTNAGRNAARHEAQIPAVG